eukprot:TRINITY_DN4306_c0_g1_i2.p1 TRINITY_DN4306_c0_g1~~TRINITY_DN4306_c0_g1_i2.p1  ORF type:complete len:322 (-),score=68.84 TRINITY_DN4306_c0_g1_i2:175-1140(-)
MWQGHDLHTSLILYQEKRAAIQSGLISKFQSSLPFPMFPCFEKRSLFDEYGEVIRPDDYKTIAEQALKEQDEEFKGEIVEDMEVEDESKQKVVEDIPTKCVLQTVKVTILCGIQYIDFEGRSDGRSVKKILSHVQPRKLVLVHGGPESTSHLALCCSKMTDGPKSIYQCKVGETVDVTEATDLYRIHLKSNLFDSLKFVSLPNNTLVSYVDGIIMVPPQEQDEDGRMYQPEPYLDVLPHNAEPTGHPAILIGDVMLSNFRQKLHDAGFRAEFNKGGVLVVNGTVALRREMNGGECGIHVEGALCDDYFKVRELLYGQYTIL